MKEERCDCGKLLFKKTSRGFEFKCNRCKRIHLIPFDRIHADEFHPLCPVMDEETQHPTHKPVKK